MLGLVQVDVDRARRPRRSQDRLSEATRRPQQPPQRQRLGRLHRDRAGGHAAHDRVDLRHDQGVATSRATSRRTRSAATCASPAPGGSPRPRSISGNVEIIDTQDSTARSRPQSVSGNVAPARSQRRGSSTLGTVSGNVTLEDVQCDRVEAQSISGNVEFGGALAQSGRYELNSLSGDVRIAVAGGHRLRARGQLLQRRRPVGPALTSCRAARQRRPRPRAARCAGSTATAAPCSTSPRSPARSSSRSGRRITDQLVESASTGHRCRDSSAASIRRFPSTKPLSRSFRRGTSLAHSGARDQHVALIAGTCRVLALACGR